MIKILSEACTVYSCKCYKVFCCD